MMNPVPPAPQPSLKPVGAYDCLLKFVIVGEPSVGKTSLALRFAEDKFPESYVATIAIDFQVRAINLQNGKHAKLQIWDTAGQERYNSITTAYYRSSHGIMMVYDVTKVTSFEALSNWLNRIKENAPPDVVIMLVGNKCEMTKQRQVPRSVATKFAIDHQLLYAEVSAKNNLNIEEAFSQLAEISWQRAEEKSKMIYASGVHHDGRAEVRLNSISSLNSRTPTRCCRK